MHQRADWLAWSLHFLAGLGLGVFLGRNYFFPYHGMTLASSMSLKHGFIFYLGVALLFAGLASHYGDRFFVGNSYRVIPPPEIEQNHISRICSLATGALGGLMMLAGLLQHFGVIGR